MGNQKELFAYLKMFEVLYGISELRNRDTHFFLMPYQSITSEQKVTGAD